MPTWNKDKCCWEKVPTPNVEVKDKPEVKNKPEAKATKPDK